MEASKDRNDLLRLVGKREEKRSLGTRDPGAAKRLHAAALAEIELRWSNLRSPPKALSEREAFDLAAPLADWWIAQHRENPSAQKTWKTEFGDRVFAPLAVLEAGDLRALNKHMPMAGSFDVLQMEQWCLQGAAELSEARGLQLDETCHRLLARCIARVVQRASLQLKRLADGEPLETFSPFEVPRRAPPASSRRVIVFPKLVEGWIAERRPAPKTIYEWQRVIKQLASFLGHENASALTADDLLRWKSSLVEAGLRSKTVRDAKLAPVRAILQWGVQNLLLADNVAEKVTIDVRAKQGEKKRSFTDEEGRIILRAALSERDPVRRWVPWIGAYSGARVSEICQLRREDVVEIEGVWCLKVMPEAGSVKTSGSERIIPLHPALVASGFLEFALKRPAGPIFSGLTPDKFGKRGGNGTKVIGRFVRQLGIVDPRISPSHSWRHRIKTLGRRHGLAQDILEAITGHGSRSVADAYGEFPVEALYRELTKIPSLQV
ncbi:site-specific integrase [Bradyrhizobium sp. AUGA SZCCT0182]|nr:site-specific integrase [Bradyrhizobium sp. AUGA SZCCT0182]